MWLRHVQVWGTVVKSSWVWSSCAHSPTLDCAASQVSKFPKPGLRRKPWPVGAVQRFHSMTVKAEVAAIGDRTQCCSLSLWLEVREWKYNLAASQETSVLVRVMALVTTPGPE